MNGGECISHILQNGVHIEVDEMCFCKDQFYGPRCEFQSSRDPNDPESNAQIQNIGYFVTAIVLTVVISGFAFVLGRKMKNAELKKRITILRSNSRNGSTVGMIKTHSRSNSRNEPVAIEFTRVGSSRNLEVPQKLVKLETI